MKKTVVGILLAFLAGIQFLPAQGTIFTYQGRLMSGGSPANGTNYGMVFYVYDAPANGNLLGNEGIASVTVSNGLFTVPLDFGNVFNGHPRWLEVAVQNNGGGFTTLAPRQPITPAPQAMFANTASNVSGTVSASQLSGNIPAASISGTISLAQLPAGVLTNGASGVSITGTFHGNGAGMTNVSLDSLNSNGAGAISEVSRFQLSSSPSAGSFFRQFYSVCAADVNGDGKMDLICGNTGDNVLEVFTNNGAAGFVLASSPGVGNTPKAICAADVNGDGKIDLISANFFDNTLTILTNDGSGGFVLASSPGVGGFPQSVCAADVNGDGKVDLISANEGDNTLTILTNNGSGGFVLASSPVVANNSFSVYFVCAADVNGDGKVDLISANYGDNTLTILTNNGSGGFAIASSPGVGRNPYSVCAADINGDGKVDLISANYSDNTLTILTNNGSGGFGFSSSPGVGRNPQSVCAADVNGHGKLALISANSFDNTLTVLTNNGSGGFGFDSSPGVGRNPDSVCAADVNGDGYVDLISANYTDKTLTVLTNLPSFVFNGRFTGSYSGDGSALTSLNTANLIGTIPTTNLSGTIPDSLLSANVPLLNGNQTFSGTNTFSGTTAFPGASAFSGSAVFSGTNNFSGTLTIAKWKVTSVINQTGQLNTNSTGTFVSSGGTLMIFMSGSGYTTLSETTIGMRIYLDGFPVDACTLFANTANVHLAFVPRTFIKTGVAAGTHTVLLQAYPASTSTDSSDNFCVTVQELPF